MPVYFIKIVYAIGGYGLDKKVGTFFIDHSRKEFGF